MNVAAQIAALAEKLGGAKAEMTALTTRHEALVKSAADIDAETADDDQMSILADLEVATDELETRKSTLDRMEKQLNALRKSEQASVEREAKPAGGKAPTFLESLRKNANTPGDTLMKAGLVKIRALYEKKAPEQVLAEQYKDDEAVKALVDMMSGKAAVNPADTTTPTWAAELVQADIRGLLESVESESVAAALALAAERNGGMRINFGPYGSVTIPQINPTGANPTEPAWVGEGGAIPMMQFGFSSATINRFKLA